MSTDRHFGIRVFAPEDLPEVVHLFQRAVREISIADYSSVQVCAWAPDVPDLAAWEARLSHGLVLIYAIRRKIAGFIKVQQTGYIDLLFVHPEYKRQGIASALLERTIEWAYQQRLTSLFTEASLTARPFFECHGFSVIRSQQVVLREVEFKNFLMERSL